MKKQQRGRTGSHRRPRKSPERQKSVLFDIISGTVLIVAVCVFVFSLYQLVMMLIPYYTGGKEYDEIQDLAVEADADGTGFSVDFDELLAINSDTIAWIRFDEPSIINYPVVKSADNEEYLTKTFAENDNKLGAIFMDMRNNSDFSDRNTIIYGHHLNVSPDMFSRLNMYEDEEFCKEHPDFYIYTPDGKIRTYTVFAAGEISAVSENYVVDFASDEEYEAFLGKCSADSAYPVDVELNAQSQIITLSTCTNDGDANRFVVRGVLTAID
ncbi:MAG TPA: class B sortase [Candidatus Mediterraneibacter guildfordensis]|jgi:SrtB family sortase|nr:class B sortase [Candidatus Mediterraneibacter guildfordensis]